MVPIGQTGSGDERQHRRYGSDLLTEAEKQAEEEGYQTVAIMAGVGVRPYYKRLGYARDGPHMVKKL